MRDREPVTIEHVLDQFDYARKLVGVEHLAVGSDLDVGNANPIGGGFQPSSQPNFARYGFHTAPGWQIAVDGLGHPKRMILGGNAVRVLSAIWTPVRMGSGS